ncbi:MAG: type I-E CRISPR-associated protein Cas7/Cse4/CasC [Planctomycetia bacterium]|nr:type I-E CRISPR-associated protein Cas7/Cse4/CasC [Planctomycetia bacterium]
MKLIELHLLQSFPGTCLNRDDVGAPKSILFGGVNRARVSSQCWKRAIRELAMKYAPENFAGKRGKYHTETLEKMMIELGIDPDSAKILASEALLAYSKNDDNKKEKSDQNNSKDKKKDQDDGKTPVALYFTPNELATIAQNLKNEVYDKFTDQSKDRKENKKITDKIKKAITKAIKNTPPHDFADIAIMGRMVAADPSLMLEGAGMFSHAISTHAVANEIDFFSAVDDTQPLDTAGAGHIGTLEMNSACYYRYIGLNIDLLFDNDHLGKLESPERKAILATFLKAVIEAVPGARKNSMFGFTRPQFVLGLVRTGQPLSLANAFEEPVQLGKKGGYVSESIEKLNEHLDKLQNEYDLKKTVDCEGRISDKLPLDAWIEKMITSALEG